MRRKFNKYFLLIIVMCNVSNVYPERIREINNGNDNARLGAESLLGDSWEDKILSLGLYPALGYFSMIKPGVQLNMLTWPSRRSAMTFEITYYPPSEWLILGNIGYWSGHEKFGWFLGGGGGYIFRLLYPGPLLNITAGLDWLLSEQYSLGAKVNGGYEIFSPYDSYYFEFVIKASFVFFKPGRVVSGKRNLDEDVLPPIKYIDMDSEINMGRINLLIKKNLFKYSGKIQDEAKSLTPEYRSTVFNSQKKDFILPLVLNGLVGFGIGSFIQQDKIGGTIGLIGDLTGATLMTLIAFPIIPESYRSLSFGVGLTIILINRVIQLIAPVVYSEKYNEELRKSLLISMEFHPVIRLALNDTTLGGEFTARF